MAEAAVSNQLEFTFDELMTDDEYDEPMIAEGVRCHGGYRDGKYVSPRGVMRRPAIESWRRRLAEDDHPLVHIPDKYVPPNYPSVAQAKYLLQAGVVEPVTRSLTIISIVEGFGARIRDVAVPDLNAEIKEAIDGTALAHLTSGLFEAHARDEAGYRDQGGHKQMWEAARDIGLDKPTIPNDILLRLMSGPPRGERKRLFPALSEEMEGMITMMANVLVIETFADNTFTWAESLLGDPEVSANPELAAHMVSCIASDEIPHVDYLTVALSEIRARTLIASDGSTELQGAQVVDAIFRRQLKGMATQRPRDNRERMRSEIHEAIDDAARAATIARKFEDQDSGWEFPHQDDEELDVLLTPA
ncbi:MAG: hypothetical protein O7G86_19250 [Gammaproteobacteria bacterium]|nr:hypothetical protein [Gammaproteobacteria bacterium]